MIKLPSTEEINRITRDSLRENFPFYEEKHWVFSIPIDEAMMVSYRTKLVRTLPDTSTYFDLELRRDFCYLNYIQLEESLRGNGNGWRLYEAIHELSRKLKLRRVIQTPSKGFFHNGELSQTRLDYLLKRGYRMCNDVEVEITL